MLRACACLLTLLPLAASTSHAGDAHHASHKHAHRKHEQSTVDRLRKKLVTDHWKEQKLEVEQEQKEASVREMQTSASRVEGEYKRLLSEPKHEEGKFDKEAAEANLRELQAELKALKKGLKYAKQYVVDSREQLDVMEKATANSTIPEEIKEATYKYKQLKDHADKAAAKENSMWKSTMKREVQLGEAKEQYSDNLKQLAVEEAAVHKAEAKWQQIQAGGEDNSSKEQEEPLVEKSASMWRYVSTASAAVLLAFLMTA
mmetsp:Transcript_58769/g.110100  ORF Transcript_58769/g.110100 Transcript_58769/m.110100 type:complete len:259 (+) Transcript_58769:79-855(+)